MAMVMVARKDTEARKACCLTNRDCGTTYVDRRVEVGLGVATVDATIVSVNQSPFPNQALDRP